MKHLSTPIVATTSDTHKYGVYNWHATPEPYLRAAIEASRVLPLVVPSFGDGVDFDSLLDRVDGVLVTGAKSNVHPSLYGKEEAEKYEPYDPARDSTTFPLIHAALEKGVPLLAICRGIQELNVALGGTLDAEVQEREGRMDHRSPETEDNDIRFKIAHEVSVKDGSCLADVLGAGPVRVNSLHRQGIEKLGNGLAIEATAPDGTIEAVSVVDAKAFAIGVQWHPEYWAQSDQPSAKIFAAFGEAARHHMARRNGLADAAE